MEDQKLLFENYLYQDAKEIYNEKVMLSKEKDKLKREEMNTKFIKTRKELLENYKTIKNFSEIIEPTFDCYIPNRKISLQFEFYSNKLISYLFEPEHIKKENTLEIESEVFSQDIIKGKNKYEIDIPIHYCEDIDNNCLDENFNNEEENKEKEEKMNK